MITMAGRKERSARTENSRSESDGYVSLAARARERIQQDCAYAFCFRYLRFSSREDVLTVRGCLPSFYLKQVLIAQLQRIDGTDKIDDQVDVISARGLSSVRRGAA